jgi:hypothetical protein
MKNHSSLSPKHNDDQSQLPCLSKPTPKAEIHLIAFNLSLINEDNAGWIIIRAQHCTKILLARSANEIFGLFL